MYRVICPVLDASDGAVTGIEIDEVRRGLRSPLSRCAGSGGSGGDTRGFGAHRADCRHSGPAGMAVFCGFGAAAAPQALDSIEFPLNPGKSRKIPDKMADSRERSSRETSPSTTQSTANRRPKDGLRETRGSLRGAGPGSACPGAGRGSPGRGTGDAGQKSPMALSDVQTTGSGLGAAVAAVSGRWRWVPERLRRAGHGGRRPCPGRSPRTGAPPVRGAVQDSPGLRGAGPVDGKRIPGRLHVSMKFPRRAESFPRAPGIP